jgi:hypothetical protein
MIIFTLRWKILLDAQGHKNISFLELFSYRTIDYGVSYLTPTAKLAGEPVRAAMLMRNGISFKEGLTTITIDKTIELSFTVIMFAIGCFLLILNTALSDGVAVFLALLCAFIIFLNWTFYYRILKGKSIFVALFEFFHFDKIKTLGRHKGVIEDFERPILQFYQKKSKAYFMALGLSILAFCISMFEYSLILRMVGVEPSLKITFMVFSVVGFAFLIPVPMGLGSLEAAQAWLFSSLGLSSAAGVGLAMIARARDLMWVFVAVVFAVFYGSLKKVLSEAFNNKYRNPVMKLAIYRGGQQDYIDLKIHRLKHKSERRYYFSDFIYYLKRRFRRR